MLSVIESNLVLHMDVTLMVSVKTLSTFLYV